ncbi:hypothetical protein AAHA92_17515 [Salvia divinorum]|uniref:Uncharacterized protein n=1 Tax=Salvia divinorum TaxID=28513 RepID=A0ABD1GZ03_SALDI
MLEVEMACFCLEWIR